MNQLGQHSLEEINRNSINNTLPANTVGSKATIWRQFLSFCDERKYTLEESTTEDVLADIMTDWGYNMKKINGGDYKEAVVKTMWNVTAKIMQEKYANDFKRELDPFKSLKFKNARDARDSKRRALQADPEKLKRSAVPLERSELDRMIQIWDEETPEGLQKKLFLIVSVELGWRGGEGNTALIQHFKEETNNDGTLTGRIEYNPIFNKTNQGGSKKTAGSKWIAENTHNDSNCPVRLFRKLISKRQDQCKSDRLFLTPNPFWQKENGAGWYKNTPVGKNLFGNWFKESAEKAGLDTTSKKITNHSSRATTVSTLAKAGVSEQQIMKITGHANANSIKSYLQLDSEHHDDIVKKLRTNEGFQFAVPAPVPIPSPVTASPLEPIPGPTSVPAPVSLCPKTIGLATQNGNNIYYTNCTFTCTTLHMT